MDSSSGFFDMLFHSEKLLHYGGLTLLVIIIFAETGLFIGFFLPGDALLFTSGVLCGTKDLSVNIFLLLLIVTAAAIAGNITGYFSGKMLGKRLFKRDDSFFFKKSHLTRAQDFYKKYAGSSIIAGRFLPIIRTFVPIVAGAIDMRFWKFNMFNIIGAFLWVWTFISLGYFLGKKVPNIMDHIEYIILGFFVVTTFVLVRGFYKMKKTKPVPKKARAS
ncbi:MAG: VTT domain-containing protein [Chitinophagales bacterium]